MTLAQLIRLAKARYGQSYSNAEDGAFTQPFMIELFNEAQNWVASIARPHFNPDIVVTWSAVSTYDDWVKEVSNRVIEILPASVRWKRTTGQATWSRVAQRYYESLVEEYGPLEDVAQVTQPLYFFLYTGGEFNETAEAAVPGSSNPGRKIRLVPGPSAVGSLKFAGWTYPTQLTATTERPDLQESEHYRYIPVMCMKMAEFDASRGRSDAPVDLWTARAIESTEELKTMIRHGVDEMRRGPAVSANALADAQDRRQGASQRGRG